MIKNKFLIAILPSLLFCSRENISPLTVEQNFAQVIIEGQFGPGYGVGDPYLISEKSGEQILINNFLYDQVKEYFFYGCKAFIEHAKNKSLDYSGNSTWCNKDHYKYVYELPKVLSPTGDSAFSREAWVNVGIAVFDSININNSGVSFYLVCPNYLHTPPRDTTIQLILKAGFNFFSLIL